MRLRLLAIAGTAASGTLGAQVAPRVESREVQHWSVPASYGTILVSGAGARLVASNAEGGAIAVRRRLGESRWWIGFDTDNWYVRATPAGVDSLAARSGVPGVYTGDGAEFQSYGFAVSVQYDAWRSNRLVGYMLASVGTNRAGGYIDGKCATYLAPCEIIGTSVNARGTSLAAMTGLGLRLRLYDAGGWWRPVFPQRLYAEARLANQGTADGRIMLTPLQFGVAW